MSRAFFLITRQFKLILYFYGALDTNCYTIAKVSFHVMGSLQYIIV